MRSNAHRVHRRHPLHRLAAKLEHVQLDNPVTTPDRALRLSRLQQLHWQASQRWQPVSYVQEAPIPEEIAA